MVEHELVALVTRVRFPLATPDKNTAMISDIFIFYL